MYREITVGTQSIPMKATGATPIRYRSLFGEDLLSEFSNVESNSSLAIGTISQLAYVMAMSGAGADMTKLSKDGYVEWLDQFEPFDLTEAAEAIVDLYIGNTKSTSEVKKKAGGAVKEN